MRIDVGSARQYTLASATAATIRLVGQMTLRDRQDTPLSTNSPLIDYALKGLERCWLPEQGRWSHAYHLDGRQPPNQSVPSSDVFYTLNVLLGLARVPRVPDTINVPEIFQRNAEQLLTLPVRKYAFGVALWAAAELRLDVPEGVLARVFADLSDQRTLRAFRAQDIGMVLTGVTAQARDDSKRWSRAADDLFSQIVDGYCWPSGLFADANSGPRRRFASFASQVYLTLACYSYGELKGDARAIEMANRCSRKLISLQGPNGEWPWFFDAKHGLVVDFYEIYSVHQFGMAPAFLEIAERHGVSEARNAAIKGFNWVFGANQLAKPMLVPAMHLSIRSQVRKGELRTDKCRMLRAIRNSALRRASGLADPTKLELRLECRSYELGWILWSFGRRSDLPQLTHHNMFSDLPHAGGGQSMKVTSPVF